jgi:peptide/nickel transport system permease protein
MTRPLDDLSVPEVAMATPDADKPVTRRLSWTFVVGAVLVAGVVVVALVSLVYLPFDPNDVDPTHPLAHPGQYGHVLGTDQLGRDVLSRLLYGSRVTLLIGVLAVTTAGVVGVPVGVVAGMLPRWGNELVLRGNDVLYAFPALLLAIVFAAAFHPSIVTAMTAVGIATIPVFVRLTSAATRQVMSRDYVVAARAGGCGPGSIAFRHVLPNVAPVVIVQTSVAFGIAILAEAALSYLGLSTNPTVPTWGRMLQEAQTYLFTAPRLALWPGLAIALTVLGFNLLGDGLRDLLDPRLRDIR